MGNCLRPDDRDRNSEQFDRIPTLQPPTKQIWFKHLKTQNILYFQSSYLNKKYDHPSFLQIDKDIDRTYPNEAQFHKEDVKEIFKKALQEIALYFPKPGYIQGVNFLVGFFVLQEMNQLQTIKSFISVVTHPKLMMLGLYEDDFPLARLNCQLFWSIFLQRHPKLANKIKNLNIPDQLWVFQWFICLFLYSFPILYMKDILTFIFQQKEHACIKIALSIMNILQPILLKHENTFEDEFIESMQMLRTQEYVIHNLPIKKIIKKAMLYDSQLFQKHLQKVNINNWYQEYFQAKEDDRNQMHKKFIKELSKQRKSYFNMVDSGVQHSYVEKEKKSLTIIDYIQELRVEKIGATLVNSLNQRVVNSSFVKHKQRYSLSDEHQSGHNGHLTLVQSIYNQ